MHIQPITFGNPDAGDFPGTDIRQNQSNDCAVKCQQIILKSFGIEMDEQDLINEAVEHGWFTNNGTPMKDVGNLLNLHGVETTAFLHANQYSLIKELASGHHVIVGVDSGELWKPGFLEKLQDKLGISAADHAVIINGLDATDPNDVKVSITDPGTGRVASYSYHEFADAWQDSECYMLSTNSAPPTGLNMETESSAALFQTLGAEHDGMSHMQSIRSMLTTARFPVKAAVENYQDIIGSVTSYISSVLHSHDTTDGIETDDISTSDHIQNLEGAETFSDFDSPSDTL